jgi:LPXTG-motif cell wall-anchored protein
MPVLGMVLLGLELLAAGTFAVLFVRRRSGGAHR